MSLEKKVVIFDRFYWNPDPRFAHKNMDLERELDEDRHEVTAYAYNLGKAARLLLAIKDGEVELPDVIITGAVLEGQADYEFDPPIFSSKEDGEELEEGVSGFGKRLLEKLSFFPPEGPSRQFLLPVVSRDGTVTLPEAAPEGAAWKLRMDIQKEYARLDYLEARHRSGGDGAPAGYVLAHLANCLLNTETEKHVKIIGHSSFSRDTYGKNTPLDAYVSKEARPGSLKAEIDGEG